MSRHEAWTALRHGGNLLSVEALEALPEPSDPPWGLADKLRTALVELDPDKPSGPALGALLDTVLETTLGLHAGWQKGSALGASESERLLDGTAMKPRRLWTGPAGETLAVFTTKAPRIGRGRGRRPVARVVEYLRRRDLPLAFLTNGTQWRLIWADIDGLAWAEWEADRWLEADHLSDALRILRHVVSWATLTRGDAEHGPLLAGIRETRRGQARLSRELGERVRRSVETLLRSRAPIVGPAWDAHENAELYVAACHFVMRLVVILFAESRDLLPRDNPAYHQAYGLLGLLDQLDRQSPERRRARHMAWPRLLGLFKLLHTGSPHPALNVQRYGGDLFRPADADGDGVQRALALLEALPEPPDDDTIHRILVLLTRTTQRVRDGSGWRRVAAPVDFTDLTSEYIGILYEGLLDYELNRAGDEPVVFLNLGDQPALPLDRLEAMDDKALKDLVEKAKVKKKASTDEDEADGDDEAADDTEEEEDAEDEESTAGDDQGEDSDEDLRAAARARAITWGRRAAAVAKLVKKPRSRSAEARAKYQAQLDHAASQLVADLKLPGELYLVRWGGTRKGAGTFYTRPQLTLPTVRRTLEPLLHDEAGRVRPPEDLLALNVCDPAMGSGSFLVAALRILTDAVVASLHEHGRIHTDNGRTEVACDLLAEKDRALPTEGFEERLEALVRRVVVEHCIYGVDKDPLAVELARVSLWVETLDRDLPFTFLDHKLRCGDSLVGTWLDRFRDYPLLALERKSPDEKRKGVNHPANTWHNALKDVKKAVRAEQAELIGGQVNALRSAVSDEELQAAVKRVRRLYRDLRGVPAARPDERARIWRKRIQPDPALEKVRTAFDTWCALWFWPLDALEVMPTPRQLLAPGDAALAVVRRVRERQRFFHWELAFPDVFTEPGAGFDAIVGNPPWETLQPQSKEFFTNHDPLYRSYGKQQGLKVQKRLFEEVPAIEDQWLAYVAEFKAIGNWLNHVAEPFGDGKAVGHDGGHVSIKRGQKGLDLHRTWRARRARYRGTSDPEHPFRHQGSGKAYTHKMFVEQSYALLRQGGQLGMVVPSGLYTDKGTGDLRRLLLKQCRWRWLYGFENRKKVFDIDSRFKFGVFIAEKGGETEAVQAAFMRHDLEDWAEARGVLDYPAERIQSFSPKSLSVLELRSDRDLEVLTKLYDNGVLLGDDGPDGWGITYAQGDFNMTSDSKLFIARDKAEADGFAPDVYGRWVNSEGEVLLPLYEGRMIGQFDFSEKGWVSGKGRSAVWREISWEEKRVEPQFVMRRQDFLESGYAGSPLGRASFMDVTSSTNRRTMVSALVPPHPCGNKVPVLTSEGPPAVVVACLNSSVFDWQLRQRLGGITLNYFIVEETVLPRMAAPPQTLGRVSLSLAGPSPIYATDWLKHRSASVPWKCRWAITPHERLRLRCMVDAIVAALYGLDRDDFAWILKDCDHPSASLSQKDFARRLDPKGFWRVDKTEQPELRHTVLSLAAFDDLAAAIERAGDRDAGIEAFCDQHDGDGWMLPETLCLADLGLTRTVDVGDYDERARTPHPVRSRMGPRFLDWQLEQSVEESWAECARHAAVLRGEEPVPEAAALGSLSGADSETRQTTMFDE